MDKYNLLINEISNLSFTDKVHINNILKINNIPYTKNFNGYFYNITNNDELYNKLKSFLISIQENKNNILLLNSERQKTIDYYTKLCNDNINNSLQTKKDIYYSKLKLINKNTNISISFSYKYTISKKIFLFEKDKEPNFTPKQLYILAKCKKLRNSNKIPKTKTRSFEDSYDYNNSDNDDIAIHDDYGEDFIDELDEMELNLDNEMEIDNEIENEMEIDNEKEIDTESYDENENDDDDDDYEFDISIVLNKIKSSNKNNIKSKNNIINKNNLKKILSEKGFNFK